MGANYSFSIKRGGNVSEYRGFSYIIIIPRLEIVGVRAE